MVRWLRWHCPPDTGFEIRALAVWGRARYLSVTEAPHNTNFHTWMGKKHFCFFQTAETGNRTPNSGVKGSGANLYPRAPALEIRRVVLGGYSRSAPLFSKWLTQILGMWLVEMAISTNHKSKIWISRFGEYRRWNAHGTNPAEVVMINGFVAQCMAPEKLHYQK